MAREIRIGMIGYGQMGRIHAYAYRSIPIFYDPLPFTLKLQAVADVVPGAADKAVQQAGDPVTAQVCRAHAARFDWAGEIGARHLALYRKVSGG